MKTENGLWALLQIISDNGLAKKKKKTKLLSFLSLGRKTASLSLGFSNCKMKMRLLRYHPSHLFLKPIQHRPIVQRTFFFFSNSETLSIFTMICKTWVSCGNRCLTGYVTFSEKTNLSKCGWDNDKEEQGPFNSRLIASKRSTPN